jgi:hypothetical protein
MYAYSTAFMAMSTEKLRTGYGAYWNLSEYIIIIEDILFVLLHDGWMSI